MFRRFLGQNAPAMLRKVTVHSSQELLQLDNNVSELVVGNNCCNDITELDLCRFKQLVSLRIGEKCFRLVNLFKIDGLNQLTTITVLNDSFTKVSVENLTKSNRGDIHRSFIITNCKKLAFIQIGARSFIDFAGQFELKNLPSLKTLNIGLPQDKSLNFCENDLVLRGTIIKFWLLSRLAESWICLCWYTSFQWRSSHLIFKSFPLCISWTDLPKLESIELGGGAILGGSVLEMRSANYRNRFLF